MKIFKELNKLGYKHYTEYTIEELDNLPLNSEKRTMEQSLVFRWFREKHNLITQIQKYENDYIACLGIKVEWCETYEEAELACLKKLIEIAKNKPQKENRIQDISIG